MHKINLEVQHLYALPLGCKFFKLISNLLKQIFSQMRSNSSYTNQSHKCIGNAYVFPTLETSFCYTRSSSRVHSEASKIHLSSFSPCFSDLPSNSKKNTFTNPETQYRMYSFKTNLWNTKLCRHCVKWEKDSTN